MAAEKSPVKLLLDLTVYAPLGLAVTARERLPELIEKGRQYAGTQLNSTRIAGSPAPDGTPGPPPKEAKPDPAGATTPTSAASPPNPADTEAPGVTEAAPAPSGAHLAIPGYDTLSASQVVQRLAGLAGDELEAVRAYEEATRGRRTILAKVSQLQAAS